MATTKRVVYWDNCIFIAWLNDEPNEPHIIEGIQHIVKQVDTDKINLITSVVTRTELLENRMSDEARDKFDRLFDRTNVTMINLDKRVADLSHEIRSYYDARGIVLGTPDCQHVATAILYRADEFQTLDGSGKKKKGKLIPLSGTVAGKYPMKICSPYTDQPGLFTALKP
jgi:predicted nucleic acid-binding protein